MRLLVFEFEKSSRQVTNQLRPERQRFSLSDYWLPLSGFEKSARYSP
jgi:hypothetical protein